MPNLLHRTRSAGVAYKNRFWRGISDCLDVENFIQVEFLKVPRQTAPHAQDSKVCQKQQKLVSKALVIGHRCTIGPGSDVQPVGAVENYMLNHHPYRGPHTSERHHNFDQFVIRYVCINLSAASPKLFHDGQY